MRLRPAHNEYRLSLLALFATLATAMLAQSPKSATPTLDLTKPVPREEQPIGVPGSEIGGVQGQPLSGRYHLPLAVKLKSLSPPRVRVGKKFTVQVLLRNTGDSDFLLPASRNAATVRKQGNTGRRTFLFSLTMDDPTAPGRPISAVMASTDGANTIPDSFLRIEPGQSVRVIFTGYPLSSWYPTQAWQRNRVRVRAQVSEQKYEDKRYFIENEAEPVPSDNSVLLDLAPPDFLYDMPDARPLIR